MPLEARPDGTLVYGYLDTDSRDRASASDTVLVKAATPYAAETRPTRFGALTSCDIVGEQRIQVSPHGPADGFATLLGLLLEGEGTIEQDGRRCALSPGEFVLYSTGRPFRLDLGGDRYRWFLIRMDRDPVTLTRHAREALVNPDFTRSPGGRILASMLIELADRGHHLGPLSRGDLGEHVTALVRTLVRECGGHRGPSSAPVLDSVLEHIDRHLAEALSPARIAAAHHISVRSLHAMFHGQGETVGEHIRRRRLDRIRQDLTDPRLAHLPAYALAARWGLHDPSHFGKLFKAEFGTSPGELRDRYGCGARTPHP